MSNILNNTTSLQEVLEALQTKAVGGEQATPVISVNNTNGLITATAGTKTATKQLAFQAAKTITPGTMDQIAVSSGYYAGGNITVKGDSNLVASNIISGKSIFGVVGTATASGGSIDTSIEDSLITGTITDYTNDRVTSIGVGAFAFCDSLTSVNFPAVTSIGDSAFDNCYSLTSVNFPAVTSIGNSAFDNCRSLTSASFPQVTSIGDYAFYGCKSLTSASFPQVTSIGGSAFLGCYSLTSVSFPQVTSIGERTFYNCSSLTSVSFPQVTSIGQYAFYECSKLSEIHLTNSSRCTLANSNAFSNTSITSTTGSIYVPTSLVTSYKTATNWTYFSNRIFGV